MFGVQVSTGRARGVPSGVGQRQGAAGLQGAHGAGQAKLQGAQSRRGLRLGAARSALLQGQSLKSRVSRVGPDGDQYTLRQKCNVILPIILGFCVLVPSKQNIISALFRFFR